MIRLFVTTILAIGVTTPLAAAQLRLPDFITPEFRAILEGVRKSVPPQSAEGAHVSRSAVDGAQSVRAVWRSASYDGPSHRTYDCVPALNAVVAALDATESRPGQRGCSGSRGLFATWTALTPLKAGEAPSGDVVEATWARANLQYSMSDSRGCSAFVETLEYMLDRLPVRNVNESVFCQPGSSLIMVSFEYLTLL